MEIVIKVISTEIIKPSSPTPKSLQKCQLSFLDQAGPSIMSPIVYFYSSNPKIPNSDKTKQLKKSLSETLSTYYPLAGCVVDNLYVDCNDNGVPFFEAEVNYNLSPLITNPNLQQLTKLLPNKLTESQNYCLAVQATYFRCGGVAIGVIISHKIADGFSTLMFIKSWSAMARKGDVGGMPIPKFDGAACFPPQNIPELNIHAMSEEELCAKVFTFPSSKIAILQGFYSGASRVQAVIAHIWTTFLSAAGVRPDPNKIYCITQSMNLRASLNDLPPSEYHFGNFVGGSITMPAAGESGDELVQKLKQANIAAPDSYLARLKEAREKGVNLATEILANAHKTNFVSFNFSSLCGFPLFEADFGWGKPVWVGVPCPPAKNMALLMSSNCGGIDVMVMLSKQDMQKFEAELGLQQLLRSNL